MKLLPLVDILSLIWLVFTLYFLYLQTKSTSEGTRASGKPTINFNIVACRGHPDLLLWLWTEKKIYHVELDNHLCRLKVREMILDCTKKFLNGQSHRCELEQTPNLCT